MGQYFKYINLDKKEFLSYEGSLHKLMEWSWEMNNICLTVKSLLASPWKGDRVYLIGDYYDEDEDAFANLKYAIISDPILNSLSEKFALEYGEEGRYNINNLFSSEYDEIKEVSCNDSNHFVGYIAYNHSKHEVCNLAEGVFEHIDFRLRPNDNDAFIHMWRIDPLNILLAINATGGGGGYFSNACKDLVGSWAFDDIELFTLDSDPKLPNYSVIEAEFTENDTDYLVSDAPDFFKANRFPSLTEFIDYYSNHSDELKDLISKPYFNSYDKNYDKDPNFILSLCGINDSNLNDDVEFSI